MRLKTLGVLITAVLAAFTMLYWMTDAPRREATAAQQEEELLEFGKVIFADSDDPASVGCARCHGDDGTGGDADSPVIGPNLHSQSLAAKLKVNEHYVHLAVSYGGVVVSGNVNSPMPAWSNEVGGPLNEQQIDAVEALVKSWAAEAANQPPEEVENTVEAGAQVFQNAGCVSCHGADLAGTPAGPDITTIGTAVITDLPTEPSGLDQMLADYEDDPRNFLELWIRDSAGNYNDGESTGMPPHPEGQLSDSQLQALITFLLEGDHGG